MSEKIAQIRQHILDLFETFTNDDEWCLTLEASADRWIQVTQHHLNISWNESPDLAATIALDASEYFHNIVFIDCDGETYATFEMIPKSADTLAECIDQLFQKHLGLGEEYAISKTLFQI